jgi:hypothetical protein
LSAQQKGTFDYYLSGDYKRHRQDLVDVAKNAYQQVKVAFIKGNPDRSDCVIVLINGLLHSQRFIRILKAKLHLPISMRPMLADVMARYLLEVDWIEIES